MKRLWKPYTSPSKTNSLKPGEESPQDRITRLTYEVIEHLRTGMAEKGWPISYKLRQPYIPVIIIHVHSHHNRLDRLYYDIGIHETISMTTIAKALKELENSISQLPTPDYIPRWRLNVLGVQPIHPSDEDPSNIVGLFTDMARLKLTNWLYGQQHKGNWNLYARTLMNPNSIWPTVSVIKHTNKQGTTEDEITITPATTWTDIQIFQQKIAYAFWHQDNDKQLAEAEALSAQRTLAVLTSPTIQRQPTKNQTNKQSSISVADHHANGNLSRQTSTDLPVPAKRRRKTTSCCNYSDGSHPLDLRTNNQKQMASGYESRNQRLPPSQNDPNQLPRQTLDQNNHH